MKFVAEKIGSVIFGFFEKMGQSILLLVQTFKTAFQKDFPWKETMAQFLRIGYKSLPVIMITAFFTGMVLAFQAGSYMETKIKGISRFMGGGIAITMVRELGPVLTSLLVAGRAGSAIAAEIGTMRVTEQIDALITLATNPVKFLILPRVVAGMITVPLLVIFADIMGVFGGSIIARMVIGQPFAIYYGTIAKMIDSWQVFHGLIKSFFFGLLVTFLSCARGFQVTGGAREVGIATTQAVVSSSMSIFFADYFLTAIL